MPSLSFALDPEDPFFLECVRELRAGGVTFPEEALYRSYELVYGHVSHAAQYSVFWESLENADEIDLAITEKSFYNVRLKDFRGKLPVATAQRAYSLLTLTMTREFRTILNHFFNKMVKKLAEQKLSLTPSS